MASQCNASAPASQQAFSPQTKYFQCSKKLGNEGRETDKVATKCNQMLMKIYPHTLPMQPENISDIEDQVSASVFTHKKELGEVLNPHSLGANTQAYHLSLDQSSFYPSFGINSSCPQFRDKEPKFDSQIDSTV